MATRAPSNLDSRLTPASAAARRHELGRSRHDAPVISRAADMLRRIAAAPGVLPAGEERTIAGLPRTPVQRIGAKLRQSPISGASMAAASANDATCPERLSLTHGIPIAVIHPFVEQLSIALDETVALSVLDAGEILFFDERSSRHRLRVVADAGSRLPTHCTASGKILLSMHSAAEIEHLLPPLLTRFTEHTITDRARLLDEIEAATKAGIAFNHEEHTVGVSGVSTAICLDDATFVALTVIVPAARFHDSGDDVVDALVATRDRVQAALANASLGTTARARPWDPAASI